MGAMSPSAFPRESHHSDTVKSRHHWEVLWVSHWHTFLIFLLGKHSLLCPSVCSFLVWKCPALSRYLEVLAKGDGGVKASGALGRRSSTSVPASPTPRTPGLGPGKTALADVLVPTLPLPHGTVSGLSLSGPQASLWIAWI